MTTKVILTYFKTFGGFTGRGGKYYTSEQYFSDHRERHLILEEVEAMARGSRLPGLVPGHSKYHVLVEFPDRPEHALHLFVW